MTPEDTQVQDRLQHPTDHHDQASSESPATEPSRDPVADLQARIDSLEDSLLRSKADFQNLQRRSANERNDAVRYANADMMKSLLGVLDDFERSLTAAQQADIASPVLDGVRLIHANLQKALFDFGLEPIEAKGRQFDPTIHEALLHQPTGEVPPGTVVEQVARGYRLRDRVLRPARVVVAKAVE